MAYCSSEHQSVDWAAHKIECRLSKSIPKRAGAGFERVDPTDSKSPLSRIIFPLRPTEDDSLTQEHQHFMTYDNPMDRIKPRGKPSQRAKNIYGPGERFIVRARWAGHADVTIQQRRTVDWTTPRKDRTAAGETMRYMIMKFVLSYSLRHDRY